MDFSTHGVHESRPKLLPAGSAPRRVVSCCFGLGFVGYWLVYLLGIMMYCAEFWNMIILYHVYFINDITEYHSMTRLICVSNESLIHLWQNWFSCWDATWDNAILIDRSLAGSKIKLSQNRVANSFKLIAFEHPGAQVISKISLMNLCYQTHLETTRLRTLGISSLTLRTSTSWVAFLPSETCRSVCVFGPLWNRCLFAMWT